MQREKRQAEKLPSEKNLQNIFWTPSLHEGVKYKGCMHRATWHI